MPSFYGSLSIVWVGLEGINDKRLKEDVSGASPQCQARIRFAPSRLTAVAVFQGALLVALQDPNILQSPGFCEFCPFAYIYRMIPNTL